MIDPVMLPGAPTMGAEAGAAQWFVERLEDVRVAGALLQAAAEHVDLAVNTTRHVLADGEPGSQDDAGHGDRQSEKARSRPATQPSQAVELVLPNDMRDVPADIARSATFVVPIAREDKIVDRRLTPGAGRVAIAASAGPPAALPDAKTLAAETRAPTAHELAELERVGLAGRQPNMERSA